MPRVIFDEICLELKLQIIGYLEPFSLLQLCLVNKAFCAAVQPYIHTSVGWKWDGYQDYPAASIHLLVRTFLNRPDLAACVKELNGSSPPERWHNKFRPARVQSLNVELPESLMADSITKVHSFGVWFADQWIEGLRAGDTTAYIALLLSIVPSLRTMTVTIPFYCHPLFPNLFSSALRGNTQLPSLEHLHTVMVSSLDRPLRHQVTVQPSLLFSLPNLETLEIRNADLPDGDLPNALELRNLHLCSVSEDQVGRMLSGCPGLKKLNWFLDHYASPAIVQASEQGRRESIKFSLDKIDLALSHVPNTLTSLIISLKTYYYFLDRSDVNGPLLSLKGLTGLKRLSIPLLLLVGFEPTLSEINSILPPNLEELCIVVTYLDTRVIRVGVETFDIALKTWLGSLNHNIQLKRLSLLFYDFWTPELLRPLLYEIQERIAPVDVRFGCPWIISGPRYYQYAAFRRGEEAWSVGSPEIQWVLTDRSVGLEA
ncbi:hypothetical protein F5Y16DRAFT_400402 [Xylariaceae sp. FL0255]|nr:hypothetical protein F5Y16DRAFT_400402 [Xylariaceae sp. FL0255]